ncbi:NlpC/P60 family protein [Tistrella bauzanensis]|uniref:NlpC/P60 family protein n=1 Tax=Tistrella TaxID=171436 RepID=UPI0031F6BFB3
MSQAMWSNGYVGLPHLDHGRTRDGLDCWGLACLIYREQLAIELPAYQGYASTDELVEVQAVIAGATSSPLWVAVDVPQPFDIAVFRRGRLETHLGVMVRAGLMIHVAAGTASVHERYDQAPWRARLAGHYRHSALVSRAEA